MTTRPPRFGGIFWRIARIGNVLTRPFAGSHRFTPFAIVKHRGRRTGRMHETTVAAQRVEDGFIISLAFGEQVDWYRNVQAAGDCVIRWNGVDYRQSRPEQIDVSTGRAVFHPTQRLLFRLTGVDGYIRLRDAV